LRHERIRKKARFLDEFIEAHKKARRRKRFPHQAVEVIIPLLFRRWRAEGRGAFKTVHRVSTTSRHVALKTASAKHISKDWRIYQTLPRGTRNRYFAKIYWKTKYCLLQKYGKQVRRVSPRAMTTLKKFAKENGLWDVQPGNIRKIDGHYKIVDANKGRHK
jgi:hypothetical protein